MANVKVTTKKVVSNRQPEQKVEARSGMPAPKIGSRFEKTGFVTTDPAVVETLFANKIYSTIKRGDYLEYTYAEDLSDTIKEILKA